MTNIATKPANETHHTAKPSLRATIEAAVSRWWDGGTARATDESSDALARDRTDMAADRTLMATERTLMAWIRTSLSLLSFGFSMYKILQGFQNAGSLRGEGENTPRNIGLFLTGMGIIAMVMGTVEYIANSRQLRTFKDFRLVRPALVMAALMSITGVASFVSIIAQLF